MTKEKTNLFTNQNQEQPYYSMDGRKPNRNYKDTLFRFIFSDKEKLLGLYNALNHSNYEDATELEINTLENAGFSVVRVNTMSELSEKDGVTAYFEVLKENAAKVTAVCRNIG